MSSNDDSAMIGSSAISARDASVELCKNATTGQSCGPADTLVSVHSMVEPSSTIPGQVSENLSLLTVTSAPSTRPGRSTASVYVCELVPFSAVTVTETALVPTAKGMARVCSPLSASNE